MSSTDTRAAHPDGSPIRALVVDDEQGLRELLTMTVRAEGWEAQEASNGEEALEAIRTHPPDIVVLDVMMPRLDGLEVVSRMRREGYETPVLLLTARSEVRDRVAGLESGAEDYVTKPFSIDEVMARLRGLVARHLRYTAPEQGILAVGDLVLDSNSAQVRRGGARVELTATEFALLESLMAHEGQVLSKPQILDQVWGSGFSGRDSVVELYISYLRKKLDALGPPMIHTLRGFGYCLRAAGQGQG